MAQLPDFGLIGAGIGDFGAATGDLITQQGYYRAAQQYTSAGNMEASNARIAQASGQVQIMQERRELYKNLSGTVAAGAGAGLGTHGSMGDILRSSASQGALQQALTGAQTEMNINSHNAQSEAYYSESSQATAQGNAVGSKSGFDAMAGIASIAGAFLPMLL